MKMSGPALMNRCLDGKKSSDRHQIGAPITVEKWVYMVAFAVKSIGEIKLLEAAAKKYSIPRPGPIGRLRWLLRMTRRGGLLQRPDYGAMCRRSAG